MLNGKLFSQVETAFREQTKRLGTNVLSQAVDLLITNTDKSMEQLQDASGSELGALAQKILISKLFPRQTSYVPYHPWGPSQNPNYDEPPLAFVVVQIQEVLALNYSQKKVGTEYGWILALYEKQMYVTEIITPFRDLSHLGVVLPAIPASNLDADLLLRFYLGEPTVEGMPPEFDMDTCTLWGQIVIPIKSVLAHVEHQTCDMDLIDASNSDFCKKCYQNVVNRDDIVSCTRLPQEIGDSPTGDTRFLPSFSRTPDKFSKISPSIKENCDAGAWFDGTRLYPAIETHPIVTNFSGWFQLYPPSQQIDESKYVLPMPGYPGIGIENSKLCRGLVRLKIEILSRSKSFAFAHASNRHAPEGHWTISRKLDIHQLQEFGVKFHYDAWKSRLWLTAIRPYSILYKQRRYNGLSLFSNQHRAMSYCLFFWMLYVSLVIFCPIWMYPLVCAVVTVYLSMAYKQEALNSNIYCRPHNCPLPNQNVDSVEPPAPMSNPPSYGRSFNFFSTISSSKSEPTDQTYLEASGCSRTGSTPSLGNICQLGGRLRSSRVSYDKTPNFTQYMSLYGTDAANVTRWLAENAFSFIEPATNSFNHEDTQMDAQASKDYSETEQPSTIPSLLVDELLANYRSSIATPFGIMNISVQTDGRSSPVFADDAPPPNLYRQKHLIICILEAVQLVFGYSVMLTTKVSYCMAWSDPTLTRLTYIIVFGIVVQASLLWYILTNVIPRVISKFIVFVLPLLVLMVITDVEFLRDFKYVTIIDQYIINVTKKYSSSNLVCRLAVDAWDRMYSNRLISKSARDDRLRYVQQCYARADDQEPLVAPLELPEVDVIPQKELGPNRMTSVPRRISSYCLALLVRYIPAARSYATKVIQFQVLYITRWWARTPDSRELNHRKIAHSQWMGTHIDDLVYRLVDSKTFINNQINDLHQERSSFTKGNH